MVRAHLLLDVQFDPSVAEFVREVGYDVVQAHEPHVNVLETGDRILLTIIGDGPLSDVACNHDGSRMEVNGPLSIDRQIDLAHRIARTLWLDDEGQLYAMEPEDSVVGDA